MDHEIYARRGLPERGDEGAHGGVGDADGGGVDEDADARGGRVGGGRGRGGHGDEWRERGGDGPGRVDGVLGFKGLRFGRELASVRGML